MIKKVSAPKATVRIVTPTKNKVDAKALSEAVFNPKLTEDRGETDIVGLDCEMVEVEGRNEALARVSVVNYYGHVLMDKFVIPSKRITDYRSWVSGVHPEDLDPRRGAISYN